MNNKLLITLGVSLVSTAVVAGTVSVCKLFAEEFCGARPEAAKVSTFKEKPREYAFGKAMNGVRLGLVSSPEVDFVEGGGFGESIALNLSLTSSESDWERLSDIEELKSDAESSPFVIVVETEDANNDAPTLKFRPEPVESYGYRGDSSGSEWGIHLRIPLRSIKPLLTTDPSHLRMRVDLDENMTQTLTRTSQDAPLSSEWIIIELNSIPLTEAGFTRRLQSLSLQMNRQDVQRIIGEPLTNAPIEGEVKKYWPEISSKWEYRNPELKGKVLPEKEMVTLYFDENGILIGIRQAIFGC